MEILKQQCIFIDDFRQTPANCAKLFLLSHSHTDHIDVRGLRTWKYEIWCSSITYHLIRPVIVPEANLNIIQVGDHTINGVRLRCFPTFHCPGSIGFYFIDLDIMFLGDTRLISRLHSLVKTIQPNYVIIDGTHMEYEEAPSTERSFAQFAYTLRSMQKAKRRGKRHPIYLGFAHTGTVLLCQMLHIKCQIGGDLPPFVESLLHHLQLVSNESSIIAVSIRDSRANLIPSSLYYIHHHLHPVPLNKKQVTRTFVSFHASAEEHRQLKSIVPNVDVV